MAHRFALALVLSIAVSSCGPGPSTCVPGAQVSCACPGGTTGVQLCNAGGTLDACACSERDAAMADASAPIDASEAIDASEPIDAFAPIDASLHDAPEGRDAGPAPPCTDELDLLFMIDNSNSMAEEQTALTAELPRLVRILASGDRDLDGTVDFTPIGSIQIGIVTTDMGVGGASVATCSGGTFGALHGDDGVLITRGRTTVPGCMATYAPIFELMSGGDVDAFTTDVSCVLGAGTGGCGFEQQLEAVLKAMSPSAAQPWTMPAYVAPTFFGGTTGHAIGANSGFVRAGSVLAAVLVTDEEDCSAIDPGIFDPTSPVYGPTDLNLRCFTYPDAQHPVRRFVDGLSALRRDPERLVFSVLAGVPSGLSGDSRAEYETILAHPDMEERVDPVMTNRLTPSCNVPGRGTAFPPRRLVQVASELDTLGAQTSVGSICDSSFAPSIDALVASIAAAAAACE